MCEKGKEELLFCAIFNEVRQIFNSEGGGGSTTLMVVRRVSSLHSVYIRSQTGQSPGSLAFSLISPSSRYRETRESERATSARNDS